MSVLSSYWKERSAMVNSQFNQSLRPLLLLLRFIGINLFKINSSSNRCLNISYDAIWLLMNSIGQIDVMVFLFQYRDNYLMLGVETVKMAVSPNLIFNTWRIARDWYLGKNFLPHHLHNQPIFPFLPVEHSSIKAQ